MHLKPILSVASFLLASVTVLLAEPVDLTNTAGTTITATIQSVSGSEVTIQRTGDGQTFTLPLSKLNAESVAVVEQWLQAEQRRQYYPDTRPFYNLDGEMILPMGLEGNELTYFNAMGEQVTKTLEVAPMLKELVAANAGALGQNNSGAFQNQELIESVDATQPERQFAFDDRLVVLDDFKRESQKSPPRWSVNLKPAALSTHRLWELSYDIYWINIGNVPEHTYNIYSSEVWWSSTAQPEDMEAFIKVNVDPRLRNEGPFKPITGQWFRQKMYLRILPDAYRNLIYFCTRIFYGSFIIKNISLEPVANADNLTLYTLDDIKQFNIFQSTHPYEMEVTETSVTFRSDDHPLYLTLQGCLDRGYQISGEVRHEGGNLIWDPEEFMEDLRKSRKTMMSTTQSSFSYKATNASPDEEDILTIKARQGESVTISSFIIEAELLPNAGELNPYYR